MSIEEIALLISSCVIVITFGMSIYSLHIQRENYKLQRQEVLKQNNKMIDLLKKIAGVV